MYFSLSTIAFFSTIVAQVAVVVPAPLNAQSNDLLRRDQPFPASVASGALSPASVSSDVLPSPTDVPGGGVDNSTVPGTSTSPGGDNSTIPDGGNPGGDNSTIPDGGNPGGDNSTIPDGGNPGGDNSTVPDGGNPGGDNSTIPDGGNPGGDNSTIPDGGNPGGDNSTVPDGGNPGGDNSTIPDGGNPGGDNSTIPDGGNPGGDNSTIPDGGNPGGDNSTIPDGGNSTDPTSSGSRFVIYTDATVKTGGVSGLPAPKDLKGYTHLMLGFLLPDRPADQSAVWSTMAPAQRTALKQQYAAAGVKVMVSAFGGTSQPTTEGKDPVGTARTMAKFVKANNLDGIDVDYEDLKAVSSGKAVAWLVAFQSTLRQELPAGKFLISHAPLAPHFSPAFPASPAGAQGPYLQVDKKVGKGIDFYNVQFYNDNDEYSTCDGLVSKSSSKFPKSSVLEISASGVSLNKIVIGKPVGKTDAPSGGFLTPATMGQCVAQAKKAQWSAGIMGFEFQDPKVAAAFIQPSLASLGGGSSGGDNSTTTTDDPTTSTGTDAPTATGTDAPTETGTDAPTVTGTDAPSVTGTDAPTVTGTDAPSVTGTDAPSVTGTDAPSVTGTDAPSVTGTDAPSVTDTGASATGTDASATGTDASATGTDASATGTDASATGTDASATGTDASATGTDASATGTDAWATGTASATGTGRPILPLPIPARMRRVRRDSIATTDSIVTGADSTATGTDPIATDTDAPTLAPVPFPTPGRVRRAHWRL